MSEAAAIREHPGDRWRGVAALVFGACVIGFSGILVRFTGAGPAAAGFWRLAFALPWLAILTRDPPSATTCSGPSTRSSICPPGAGTYHR